MLPSNWTSSYNHQYRDWRTRMLSPHAAEPMFHFPNYSDPSHARPSQGFWGARAALAETARAQLQSELEYANGGNNNNKSFSSSYSSSSYNNNNNNNNTSRAATAPSSAPVNPPLSWRSAGYRSSATALPSINRDRRDLWSASIRPLTGTYYDINYAPPVPQAPYPPNSNYYGTSDAYINAKGENSLSSTAFIPSYSYSYSSYSTQTSSGQDVRYDDMAVGQTKHVDLGTLSEPRNKFHIPGYQGFVRGMQFQHGDTFGKTTRGCLDVPKDVPQEP